MNVCVVLTVLAGLLALAVGSENCQKSDDEKCTANHCSRYCAMCGPCGELMEVTLVFNNTIQEPKFNITISVKKKPQRALIYFLQDGSDENSDVRYVASYWGTMGYMIDGINKVVASTENKTYWQILELPSGVPLSKGVSTYIPYPGEILMFNFTHY